MNIFRTILDFSGANWTSELFLIENDSDPRERIQTFDVNNFDTLIDNIATLTLMRRY
jgi:hypothetical protein